MFTPEERAQLRDGLVAAARTDPRIKGAALTGSAAAAAEDRWSDIDLALSVADGADYGQIVADWTDRLYQECGAVHHLDVYRGETLFRVFLLDSTLQVDIAFWKEAEFGAYGPTFRLLFGTAKPPQERPQPQAAALIGMGWLYALHARSSIARGRAWQAEYMISGMRDQVVALMCLRHGAPAVEGRGIDLLPQDATAPLAAGLVRSLGAAELRRAFRAVTEALIAEARCADADLAGRLSSTLRELAA
jgi:predicted nucleotidyltransferase